MGQVFDTVAEVAFGQKDAQRYDLYVCSVLDAIAQIPKHCDRMLEAIASIEEGVQASTIEEGMMSYCVLTLQVYRSIFWLMTNGSDSRKVSLLCRNGARSWSTGSTFWNYPKALMKSL